MPLAGSEGALFTRAGRSLSSHVVVDRFVRQEANAVVSTMAVKYFLGTTSGAAIV